MHEQRKKISLEIRPIALWDMLICGVVIILIGVYLYVANNVTGGNLRVGTRGGQPFLRGPIVLSGVSTIIVGSAISAFPVFQLLRNLLQKKTSANKAFGKSGADE